MWNFATPEAVLVAARELNPVESEGFVACDSNFHRLKVCPPMSMIMSLIAQTRTL